MLELLDLVAEETEFLQCDVATQPWAAETYKHVCNAISQTKAGLWLQQGASERAPAQNPEPRVFQKAHDPV